MSCSIDCVDPGSPVEDSDDPPVWHCATHDDVQWGAAAEPIECPVAAAKREGAEAMREVAAKDIEEYRRECRAKLRRWRREGKTPHPGVYPNDPGEWGYAAAQIEKRIRAIDIDALIGREDGEGKDPDDGR